MSKISCVFTRRGHLSGRNYISLAEAFCLFRVPLRTRPSAPSLFFIFLLFRVMHRNLALTERASWAIFHRVGPQLSECGAFFCLSLLLSTINNVHRLPSVELLSQAARQTQGKSCFHKDSSKAFRSEGPPKRECLWADKITSWFAGKLRSYSTNIDW